MWVYPTFGEIVQQIRKSPSTVLTAHNSTGKNNADKDVDANDNDNEDTDMMMLIKMMTKIVMVGMLMVVIMMIMIITIMNGDTDDDGDGNDDDNAYVSDNNTDKECVDVDDAEKVHVCLQWWW